MLIKLKPNPGVRPHNKSPQTAPEKPPGPPNRRAPSPVSGAPATHTRRIKRRLTHAAAHGVERRRAICKVCEVAQRCSSVVQTAHETPDPDVVLRNRQGKPYHSMIPCRRTAQQRCGAMSQLYPRMLIQFSAAPPLQLPPLSPPSSPPSSYEPCKCSSEAAPVIQVGRGTKGRAQGLKLCVEECMPGPRKLAGRGDCTRLRLLALA